MQRIRRAGNADTGIRGDADEGDLASIVAVTAVIFAVAAIVKLVIGSGVFLSACTACYAA